MVVTVTEQLSASHSSVGDGLPAYWRSRSRTPGGATVFPRGARVLGTVVASKGQGKFKGSGALGIQVTSISGVRVNVSSYEKEQKGYRQEDCGLYRWRRWGWCFDRGTGRRRQGRFDRRVAWRGRRYGRSCVYGEQRRRDSVGVDHQLSPDGPGHDYGEG